MREFYFTIALHRIICSHCIWIILYHKILSYAVYHTEMTGCIVESSNYIITAAAAAAAAVSEFTHWTSVITCSSSDFTTFLNNRLYILREESKLYGQIEQQYRSRESRRIYTPQQRGAYMREAVKLVCFRVESLSLVHKFPAPFGFCIYI